MWPEFVIVLLIFLSRMCEDLDNEKMNETTSKSSK